MPIYEYKCRSCGKQFEKIVRGSETPGCPSCQGSDLEQLLSVPGIHTQKARKRTFGIAKKAAGEVRRDKAHAQREYETNYIKDHS